MATVFSFGNRWLDGHSPIDIAPDPYTLAWRKHENVATALNNRRWKRGLQRKATTQQINQYVHLWMLIQEVRLEQWPDDITWEFSANDKYSSSSAYKVQFMANFPDHDWERILKMKAENKCKFFSWLILQNKMWTNDRILENGGQANHLRSL